MSRRDSPKCLFPPIENSASVSCLAYLILIAVSSCHHLAPPQPPDNIIDTTSHDLSWQITSFGDAIAGSSSLKDVFILSDTLAFAVGDIRKLDSLGTIETESYNLARWDGATWTIMHARTTFRGNVVTAPMDGVIAFSDHDIWLVGTDPIHGDGVTWNDYDIRQLFHDDSMTVSHAWGENSSDIYFAGGLGTILHYFLGSWVKVSTATRLPIQDIWGSRDPTTGQNDVLCLAANPFVNPQGKMILRVSGGSTESLPDSGLALNLQGLWHISHQQYYIVGNGIFFKSDINSQSRWNGGPHQITEFYGDAIRGSNLNNVFVVGDWGEVQHFNGSTWASMKDQTGLSSGLYWSVAVKENLVIAVGDNSGTAVIAIGRRK